MSVHTTCKACGTVVRWAATMSGQRLPLEQAPSADGTIMLLAPSLCRVVPVEERAECTEPLYRTHYAVCTRAMAGLERSRA